MKPLQSIIAFCLLTGGLLCAACSDNNGNGGSGDGGGSSTIEKVHYDIWVGLDQSKMGKFGQLLVKNTNSLEGNDTIHFKNQGCDVTSTFGDTESSIIKGQYYYAVDAVNEDRFVKYRILNDQLTRVAEHPLGSNTYEPGKYTHVWTDDNTLILFAANGDASEVLWTKLDANTMKPLAEGTLGLAGDERHDVTKFTTSGLAQYRKSDNTIIYLFKHNPGRGKVAPPYFFAAFIDANSMTVREIVREDRAEEMAGSAYGELRQHKMFFDENENLYIACNSQIPGSENTTCQTGSLLRILKGQYEFDKNFEAFKGESGKIVTADYMGDNKVLLYLQDPKHTGLSDDNGKYKGWGDGYNCYYAMYDMTTKQLSEFQYNGKNLPFCSGTFSQRSFVLNDKAYIGVNPEKEAPCVYVYDMKNKTTSKGINIQDGYIFTRIVYITD